MPMKLLHARQVPGVGYRFRIWLETKQVGAGGEPHPDWVVEYIWGQQPPPGLTQAQYRSSMVAEAKALAALELAKRSTPAGTALPNEGEEF